MKMDTEIDVIKSSGEKVKFSLDRLHKSLGKSGADRETKIHRNFGFLH